VTGLTFQESLLLLDDKNRDGFQQTGSLTIQPPNVAASPRKLYWV